ncbi:hypothetical protein LP420_09430 [Massilia sp. B-10]|nr:hypothetical protein LP420_09430 [Massilia sp. B-10]
MRCAGRDRDRAGSHGCGRSAGAGAGQRPAGERRCTWRWCKTGSRPGWPAHENSGRTLHHDFVAREWAQPVLLGRDGKADITRTLPLLAGAAAASLGVSAFVQSEQGEVLQALTLNACSGAL